MAIASMPRGGRTLAAPRLTLETAAFLTFIIGGWAGIIPFVGPSFGFSGDGTGSWHWSLAHSLLFLVPGATACLMGFLAMVGAAAGSRMMLRGMGLIVATCGAWLVVGPLAWPVLKNSSVFVASSPLREFAYWVGYSLGTGGLLLALGAFMFGSARRSMVGTSGEPRYTESGVADGI